MKFPIFFRPTLHVAAHLADALSLGVSFSLDIPIERRKRNQGNQTKCAQSIDHG